MCIHGLPIPSRFSPYFLLCDPGAARQCVCRSSARPRAHPAPLPSAAQTVDANNPPKKRLAEEWLPFAGPVDAVFPGAPDFLELDVGTGAAVALTANGWPDAVVWSPWTSMEACYKEFCCVENARAVEPVTLAPGEHWRAQMEVAVVDL